MNDFAVRVARTEFRVYSNHCFYSVGSSGSERFTASLAREVGWSVRTLYPLVSFGEVAELLPADTHENYLGWNGRGPTEERLQIVARSYLAMMHAIAWSNRAVFSEGTGVLPARRSKGAWSPCAPAAASTRSHLRIAFPGVRTFVFDQMTNS